MFGSYEDISTVIKNYSKESEDLKEQIVDICYFMPSLSYNEAWGISFLDRETIVKIVNKRNKEQNPRGKEYM